MHLFNKKSLLCATLITGLNVATVYGNYPATNTAPSNTAPREYNQASSNNGFVSDQDILKAIRDKIGPGWFSSGYEQVSPQVYNGNVTLQGSVKTWEDKEKVEREVRHINGVKSLNSQLTVQEQNSPRPEHQDRGNRPGYANQQGQYAPQSGNPQGGQPGYYHQQQSNASQASYNKDAREFPQDKAGSSADDQLNKKIRDNVSRGWLWNSYKEVLLNTNNGTVLLEGFVETNDDQQKLINEIQKIEGVRAVKSNLNIRK